MSKIAWLVCFASLWVFLCTKCGHAQKIKACSAPEAVRAHREAARTKDWNHVLAIFKQFGACDTGRVAEEFSYATSRLLAHDWDHVGVLLDLAADDQSFKEFVLRHIDENFPEEEAQTIVHNARERCPENGKWLCKAIVDY